MFKKQKIYNRYCMYKKYADSESKRKSLEQALSQVSSSNTDGQPARAPQRPYSSSTVRVGANKGRGAQAEHVSSIHQQETIP